MGWNKPTAKDCAIRRKILEMVRELHLRGYERLRICPGMAPSGLFWRCTITSAANVSSNHGAEMARWDKTIAYIYSSSTREKYFDGKLDVTNLSPAEIADFFILHFPQIVEASRGQDKAYVNWFGEMLRLTESDLFPIAYADWNYPKDKLQTVGSLRRPEFLFHCRHQAKP